MKSYIVKLSGKMSRKLQGFIITFAYFFFCRSHRLQVILFYFLRGIIIILCQALELYVRESGARGCRWKNKPTASGGGDEPAKLNNEKTAKHTKHVETMYNICAGGNFSDVLFLVKEVKSA